ncbi:MAG: 60S ribosomal export protein NMD3 [Methanomicrobiales archaeon]|nr:60S ribosomal export protein NMD3 [Methanomicrobiales archaeon]
MAIQESFCPRCGAPATDGICGRCRAAGTRWLSADPRVTCINCPTCGSLRHGAAWTDMACSREDLADQLVRSALHFHPDLTDPGVSLSIRDLTPTRSVAEVRITGRLYGQPVEETAQVEIAWKGEQCDRCSRISGGYYEGVVQVRAEGRETSPFEREVADRIAVQLEDTLQAAGERLAFISGVEEKEGLDIIVGSHRMGQEIARQVTGALGGQWTVHPKLVGERDGRPVYRITYSIRLPRWKKGDVVWTGKEYLEVRESGGRDVKVFDLADGGTRSVPLASDWRFIGNVRDAMEAVVAYIDRGVIGLLDPVTWASVENRVLPWIAPREGAMLRVLRDAVRGNLVIVG